MSIKYRRQIWPKYASQNLVWCLSNVNLDWYSMRGRHLPYQWVWVSNPVKFWPKYPLQTVKFNFKTKQFSYLYPRKYSAGVSRYFSRPTVISRIRLIFPPNIAYPKLKAKNCNRGRLFRLCWIPTRSKQLLSVIEVETAVHGCNSCLSVWTPSCRCPVKLSTKESPLHHCFLV